jgi:hypothetical protein
MSHFPDSQNRLSAKLLKSLVGARGFEPPRFGSALFLSTSWGSLVNVYAYSNAILSPILASTRNL